MTVKKLKNSGVERKVLMWAKGVVWSVLARVDMAQYRELVNFSVTTASSKSNTPIICFVVAFKYNQYFQQY